jgi:four helix bundle protein
MAVQSYRELIVWQKAMELAKEVYLVTQSFPAEERFGLTSQVRRAAVSIASNIAEGQGRFSTGEFKQFLGHARGSLYEVETQMQLARDLGFINAAQHESAEKRSTEVAKLLNGLIRSLPSH